MIYNYKMGIFVPTWVIVAIVVIMVLYLCDCKKKVESLLTPSMVAPNGADVFELAMRGKMYPPPGVSL